MLTSSSFCCEFREDGLGRCTPGGRSLSRGLQVLPSNFVFFGATLVLVATLQGCATLSEADCLSADWAVMGEADGQRGRPVSELNRYRRQCAAYGVVPDSQAYLEARERGLARYCTESNGYREGRSGTPYQLVCPAPLEPDFRSGHELGRAVYASLTDLRNTNDSIDSARNQIKDLQSDISDAEASIRSDDLSDEQTERLRDEIESMNRRIKRLKGDIVVMTGSVAISIVQYRNAVEAANREGHNEPMEADWLQELWRLVR